MRSLLEIAEACELAADTFEQHPEMWCADEYGVYRDGCGVLIPCWHPASAHACCAIGALDVALGYHSFGETLTDLHAHGFLEADADNPFWVVRENDSNGREGAIAALRKLAGELRDAAGEAVPS